MADSKLNVLITAVDKLSPVLRAQAKTLNTWKRQFASMGKGAMPMAAGLGAAMLIPTKAFVEAENAATQLQNTLMDKNGISAGFEDLKKVAVQLGNQLPGTTADFMSMASQLKALGVDTNTITGGALKATAYLAVIGKPLGVTYESAAEAVGKMGKAFGIAANDLVPFADTLQRALHMGVDLTEIQYAMAKVSPELKSLRAQGLGVANDLVPLVAMLTSTGMSGETAGTGLEKVITAADKKGKFATIPALVKDLEKLSKLSDSEKTAKFQKLFGEEGARVAKVIAAGGYAEMVKKMEAQASMQQRINNALGTLGNLWEAATGTFTNAMVAFATAYAPELKALTERINGLSEKLLNWAEKNPQVIKTVLKMASAFVGVKLAAMGVAMGIGLITAAMKANPIGLLVTAIAIAAPLIIDNWDLITTTLTNGWNNCVNGVLKVWNGVVDGIMLGINAARDALNALLGLFGDFQIPEIKLPSIMPSLREMGGKLGSMVYDMNVTASHGMRAPGAESQVKLPAMPKIDTKGLGGVVGVVQAAKPASNQSPVKLPVMPSIDTKVFDGFVSDVGLANRPAANQSPLDRQRIVQAAAPAQPVKGAIEVNFNNAPQGMRVEPAKSGGNVNVKPNVGYRSFATGMQ
jgi:hypothetical protein